MAAALVLAAGGALLTSHSLFAFLSAADPAASFAPADPSAAPSTAAPSTAASRPAVPAASTARRVQGTSLIDRLDRPGQWIASPPDDNDDSCRFDRRLEVTTSLSSGYQCTGPTDLFAGDQSIAVDATVVSPGACAAIWFRVVGEKSAQSAYQASFCPREVRLGLDDEGEVTGEKKAPTTAFQPGRTHRAGIEVTNETAKVTVDGATLLTVPLTDPLLAGGTVALGAINDANNGDSQAAFADVELRSPTVGTQPAFTDLLGGNIKSVVKLYAYDPVARSAIAEPVLFLTGTDYCTRFKIKASDGRCQNEWITVDSHLKVTVPVAARPKLTAWQDASGGGDCVGSFGGGGTCPVSTTVFLKWLKDASSTGLVLLTTANGQITKLAEEYTP